MYVHLLNSILATCTCINCSSSEERTIDFLLSHPSVDF